MIIKGDTLAENIVNLHHQNPQATYKMIASLLSVHVAYVRKVAQRKGLSFVREAPKVRNRKNTAGEKLNIDSWEDRLIEKWADRPKRTRVKSPRTYLASGRQGSYSDFGYMKLT